MALTRRNFVKAAGVGGIGALATPLIAARGAEALSAGAAEPGFFPGAFSDMAVAERIAYRSKFKTGIRLDSNENPNGPGKAALEAVRAMFTEANRYPDSQEGDLAVGVAKYQKVNEKNVLMACGSGEILRSACYAFTGPGKALVMGSPTFETPGGFAEAMGAEVRRVPVDKELRLDLQQMLDKSAGAGLIFFCNPNNPTATVHGAAAVKDFIAQVNKTSPNTMILMDEAYHEYVEDPNYSTSIPISMDNPKVFTVRTFSKVFGMAGLRAGYAIAHTDTARALRDYRVGSGTSVLALATAAATVGDRAHIADEQRKNREAKAFTRAFFESAGYRVGASETNFLMIDLRRDPQPVRVACRQQGIAVGRPFPPLDTWLRLSIGTMDEMRQATAVLRSALV